MGLAAGPLGARPRWPAWVARLYTTDCVKDGRMYEYPPPGTAEDPIARSKVRTTMRTVVRNPDSCRVAASAKLQPKRGRVTVKIFDKGWRRRPPRLMGSGRRAATIRSST